MKSLSLRRSALVLATALAALAATPHAMAAGDDAQKTTLARKVIELMKPENTAVVMVEQRATDAMQQARNVLVQNHVPQDKAAAAMKDMQAEAQAFVDKASPLALETGKKANDTVVLPLLLKNFSVEELQTLVTWLQSPVRAKMETVTPDLMKGVGDKVAAEAGPKIGPMMQKMSENIGVRLRKAVAGQ